MNKTDVAAKAGKAYETARENQYVRRLVEDEELRASIIAAAVAAKSAYGRARDKGSSPIEAVQDRKVKKDLDQAVEAIREASERIKAPKKKRHTFRNVIGVGLLTGGLVLVFSESARKTVLDAVFGAEEEFVYTSTTSPASTPQTNGTPMAEQPASE
jgi:Pyruvate/2-oxoacid:ferredoxin oxidoreductase gamma subunit